MRRSVYRDVGLLSLVIPVLMLLALCWSPASLAFGPSGHRIVGYVAERYLCRETRIALEPLLITRSMTGESAAGKTLPAASVWPDTIRRRTEWQHTRPWHYINVSDHGSISRAARSNPDNVLTALTRFEAELRNTSLSIRQRAIALRFVSHFVADIHQPLHVGRATDRGGNEVPVKSAGEW
ncbi:MAG: S1/P1 nuclease [Gammaproteobacteria bacterium]